MKYTYYTHWTTAGCSNCSKAICIVDVVWIAEGWWIIGVKLRWTLSSPQLSMSTLCNSQLLSLNIIKVSWIAQGNISSINSVSSENSVIATSVFSGVCCPDISVTKMNCGSPVSFGMLRQLGWCAPPLLWMRVYKYPSWGLPRPPKRTHKYSFSRSLGFGNINHVLRNGERSWVTLWSIQGMISPACVLSHNPYLLLTHPFLLCLPSTSSHKVLHTKKKHKRPAWSPAQSAGSPPAHPKEKII